MKFIFFIIIFFLSSCDSNIECLRDFRKQAKKYTYNLKKEDLSTTINLKLDCLINLNKINLPFTNQVQKQQFFDDFDFITFNGIQGKSCSHLKKYLVFFNQNNQVEKIEIIINQEETLLMIPVEYGDYRIIIIMEYADEKKETYVIHERFIIHYKPKNIFLLIAGRPTYTELNNTEDIKYIMLLDNYLYPISLIDMDNPDDVVLQPLKIKMAFDLSYNQNNHSCYEYATLKNIDPKFRLSKNTTFLEIFNLFSCASDTTKKFMINNYYFKKLKKNEPCPPLWFFNYLKYENIK